MPHDNREVRHWPFGLLLALQSLSGDPAERVPLVVGGLDADGTSEIVIASRKGAHGLYYLKRDVSGSWHRHLMDDAYSTLEAGGALHDLTCNGRLDFVGGGDSQTQHVSWWECPDEPGRPWTRRVIHELPERKSHDQLIGDADGDGRPELYFWNQGAKTLFGVRVPDNPHVSPWPGVFPIVTDVLEEGFALADVDGDGRPNLIAGQAAERVPSAAVTARICAPFASFSTPTAVAWGSAR